MGSGASKPDGPMQIPDHVARIGFPHTLHLAWKKSWSKLVVIVSTHKGSQPLYAASMPVGFPGPTVLYPGEDIEGPPMCYVERKHNDFTIQLPGVPIYGIMPSQAAMKCENPYTTIRYTFTMPVGNGPHQHFETFEWRHSSRDEVKSLGLSGTGWKLVRTTPNTTPQNGHGSGFSSDGKEVVAIFAPAKSLSMSMTDIGGFQYFGSGTSPEMGYHWALMALLSAITLFQHQSAKNNEQTGTAAASNAAAAAAASA